MMYRDKFEKLADNLVKEWLRKCNARDEAVPMTSKSYRSLVEAIANALSTMGFN